MRGPSLPLSFFSQPTVAGRTAGSAAANWSDVLKRNRAVLAPPSLTRITRSSAADEASSGRRER